MTTETFDLVILGGGNAITVGIDAAKAGWKVAVVERDRLGGTCPNRGCIPSKLLLGHAEVAWKIREAARFHLDAELRGVDGSRILAEVRSATLDATDRKIAENLPEGITLVRGEGALVGPGEIAVGERRLRGERILLGTGSRPHVPDVEGLSETPYLTSDEVFSLERLPESLAVLGGGYIACELASFFAALGVRTTVIHRGRDLLGAADRDLRPVFTAGFTSRVPTRLETRVSRVSHDGAAFALELTGRRAASEVLRAETLLVATGRRPNSSGLGLEAVGVARDAEGQILIDDHLRALDATGRPVPGVWALGDVSTQPKFTHSAAWSARWLADHLLGRSEAPFRMEHVPHAVFATPELAGVGATEQELAAAGLPYLATSLPYAKAAKGRAIKEDHGLLKLLTSPEGDLLGFHCVGEQASTLTHQVLAVLPLRPHVSALTELIYIHPSLSELVRNLARAAAAKL